MSLVTVETYVGEEGRKEGSKVQKHTSSHIPGLELHVQVDEFAS